MSSVNSAAEGRRLREREKKFRVKTEITEDGELVILQPDHGVGSRMPAGKYQELVRYLADGGTLINASAKYGMALSTIQIIRTRHSDICPSHRKVMVQRMESIREQLIDSMEEDISADKMPRGIKPIAFGIICDKYSAETGQNVQKHEHIHAILPAGEVKTALSRLKADNEPAIDPQKTQESTEKPANAQETHKTDDPGAHFVDVGERGEGGYESPLGKGPTD